jgi:sulfoxide reductase heme-binding subunit YedZ
VTTWNVLRAAGIGAYVMLFLSVVWGLVSTTMPFGKAISKRSATLVHQFISTCGLALLGIHLGGLLLDAFVPFSVADLLVPMRATYRPAATTIGIVAMYGTVVIIVTSWLRKPIGTKWWRRSHLLAVPVFTLALLHGLVAGSDTTRPVMWWTYVVTGLIVTFLVVVRGLTVGLRAERRPIPEHVTGARTALGEAGNGEPHAAPDRRRVVVPSSTAGA